MQEMKDVQLKPVRKVWVDYVKVLGMVLIVWGHCSPSHLSAFAYAFDVQLFFWVSGYLTKNKILPWRGFFAKSLRTCSDDAHLFDSFMLVCGDGTKRVDKSTMLVGACIDWLPFL